ncbi:MAG: hypothetical protein J6W38_00355 [Prevotella sp.]|nr:hypothetical protein [Prevotella sp.]
MKKLYLFLLLLTVICLVPVSTQAKKVKYGKSVVYDDKTETLTTTCGNHTDVFTCKEENGAYIGNTLVLANGWKFEGLVMAAPKADGSVVGYGLISGRLTAKDMNGKTVTITVNGDPQNPYTIGREVNGDRIAMKFGDQIKGISTRVVSAANKLADLDLQWMGAEWTGKQEPVYWTGDDGFNIYGGTYNEFESMEYANSAEYPEVFSSVVSSRLVTVEKAMCWCGHSAEMNIAIRMMMKDGKDTGERYIALENDLNPYDTEFKLPTSYVKVLVEDGDIVTAQLVKTLTDGSVVKVERDSDKPRYKITYPDGSVFTGTCNCKGALTDWFTFPLYGELKEHDMYCYGIESNEGLKYWQPMRALMPGDNPWGVNPRLTGTMTLPDGNVKNYKLGIITK